ncbi:MAG TPA: hypothetical protein VF063_09705, partial [Gaiellaceae bacterium]
MSRVRLGSFLAVLATAVICSVQAASAQPPPGLTQSGRALWEFEALLHDTFGRLPVSGHYARGVAWNFAACGRNACSPLSYWNPYSFTFTSARRSTFHLSARRSLPSFGNYPLPIKIKRRYVACDRRERKFLVTYLSGVGLS